MSIFRLSELQQWLGKFFDQESLSLEPLTGDAGFRHYYRFSLQGISYIAVDALTDKSNNVAFVTLQKAIKKQGINTPDIIAYDADAGFFCISDFGDTLFGNLLTDTNMMTEYKQAINLLPSMAKVTLDDDEGGYVLPQYNDAFIRLELRIFTQWLVDKHLALSLTQKDQEALDTCFDVLVNNAIEQPQVTVHRDFHSRNLMVVEGDKSNFIGVIDFQDAVKGPITYDIVSLLRDCYVKWPVEKVDRLFDYFCTLMENTLNLPVIEASQWKRWFDLMGIQRHIKASGIFARLNHRDNKPNYLKDIPLTLSYIVDVSKQYPELSALHQIIETKIMPALAKLPQQEKK